MFVHICIQGMKEGGRERRLQQFTLYTKSTYTYCHPTANFWAHLILVQISITLFMFFFFFLIFINWSSFLEIQPWNVSLTNVTSNTKPLTFSLVMVMKWEFLFLNIQMNKLLSWFIKISTNILSRKAKPFPFIKGYIWYLCHII